MSVTSAALTVEGSQKRRIMTCCACVAAVALALGIYTAATLGQYTPLYRPVSCLQRSAGLGDLQMDGSFASLTGEVARSCRNPNGYPISIVQRSVGQLHVLVGNSTLVPIGQSFVREATLPAQQEAMSEAHVLVKVPATPEALAMLSAPLLRAVAEVKVSSEATLSFLGITLSSVADKDELCGFELRMADKKVGPMSCAPSLEQLVIPDIESWPQPQLVQMDPSTLEAEVSKKNSIFGSLLAVLVIVFLASSGTLLRQSLGSGQALVVSDVKSCSSPSDLPRDVPAHTSVMVDV